MTQSNAPAVLTHIDAIRATLGSLAGLDVLDIGCGASALPRELAALGAAVTGIDPFMPAVGWSPEGEGRWRIRTASAEALPCADASIDVVIFIYSLHHVPGSLLGPALKEARRVLKPRGRLYVAEPLPEGDFDDLITFFHDETVVRANAQAALEAARALFDRHEPSAYVCRKHYPGFEPFAAMMQANTRFNDYAAEDVVASPVRAMFEAISARTGGVFDQPVKVDVFA